MMFGATEVGRVNDAFGFTLRVHRDDVSEDVGFPAVILETGASAYVLTRQTWALLVSYGDQALRIHEETEAGQQDRAEPGSDPSSDLRVIALAMDALNRLSGESSPYACICGAPIPPGAFRAGYRVCREHIPNPGYLGSYDAAAGRG